MLCSYKKLIFFIFFPLLTGYLLREIKKANIAVPEAEVLPAAPAPKNVLEIMVSVEIYQTEGARQAF